MKGGNRQHDRRQRIIAIEESQLGILAEIRDQLPFRLLAVAGQKPAKVRAPKPAGQRRMEILIGIGDEVMTSMMCRPPKRSFLVRRRSGKSDQELEELCWFDRCGAPTADESRR